MENLVLLPRCAISTKFHYVVSTYIDEALNFYLAVDFRCLDGKPIMITGTMLVARAGSSIGLQI